MTGLSVLCVRCVMLKGKTFQKSVCHCLSSVIHQSLNLVARASLLHLNSTDPL